MNYLMKNAILGIAVAATAFAAIPAEAGRRNRGDALAAGLAGVALGTIIGGVLSQPRSQGAYYNQPAPVYGRPGFGSPVVYYQPSPSYPRAALGYDPAPAYQVVDVYQQAPVYQRPMPVYRSAPSYEVIDIYQRAPVYRPAPSYEVVDIYQSAPVYQQPVQIYRRAPGYQVVEYAQRQPFYQQPFYRQAPSYRPVAYPQRRTTYYGQPSRSYRAPAPWTRDWYNACTARYRSFDPRSGTFLGYDGRRHFCQFG